MGILSAVVARPRAVVVAGQPSFEKLNLTFVRTAASPGLGKYGFEGK